MGPQPTRPFRAMCETRKQVERVGPLIGLFTVDNVLQTPEVLLEFWRRR